jgi:hypothetical protein
MSKSVWGPATWHLLHCLVLKIDDNINKDQFESLKRIIVRIIHNLPCPYCTEHAISFIRNNNFEGISNISALRYFIFYFHNKVNERLKKPMITYDEHIVYYNNMNLYTVVEHFFFVYRKMNQTGVTMMLRNYHRNKVLNEINEYFIKNQSLYRL